MTERAGTGCADLVSVMAGCRLWGLHGVEAGLLLGPGVAIEPVLLRLFGALSFGGINTRVSETFPIMGLSAG